jgi:hypothetical protein
VGDVNVHLDCPALSTTKQFVSLLQVYDLLECVQQPTHNRGHQLDVYITRSDQLQPVIRVDPPIISDHSLITATYSIKLNIDNKRPRVPRRRWSALNVDDFTSDLISSDLICNPPDDVNELFASYDKTLAQLLDKHAPVVYVTQYARPSSPWFNTECHLAKVKTRKLEKLYRKHRSAATESAWRAQFNKQRILFQSKFSNYWKTTIRACANNKVLWSKLRCVLDRPPDESPCQHSADDFSDFFVRKINAIRNSTASASLPNIVRRDVERFVNFRPVTDAEVQTLLSRLPPKQCSLDPVPTWLLKQVGDVIAPTIAAMCNASFIQQTLPVSHKTAIVRPLLKQPTLDQSSLSSYRPISNLSFVSKIVERLVDRQLGDHFNTHELLPVTQSAYRAQHSTETALVKMHNDIVNFIDQGHVVALVMLDLTAAFDTVDHHILSTVLHDRFGVDGDALGWITNYLSGRSQRVSIGSSLSTPCDLPCGVPQGSVLGPRQFLVYSEDIVDLFHRRNVSHHAYADDNQGYADSDPANAQSLVANLQLTVRDVGQWCSSKRLQLNPKKTEIIWFGTSANLAKLNNDDMQLHLDNDVIEPVTIIRDLGVYLDNELSMKQHIARVARNCFYHLRRIRSISRQLGRDVAQQLVSCFVLSRLDYCNALLAGLPASTLAPLQRVQNAAARLILNMKPSDHITTAFIQLHWLPVKYRIIYKICVLVHKALNDLAPNYLRDLLNPVADVPGRSMLRSAMTTDLLIPPTKLLFGERAFSVSGATHWNNLPSELRALSDLNNFCKALKTHLFRVAFKLS